MSGIAFTGWSDNQHAIFSGLRVNSGWKPAGQMLIADGLLDRLAHFGVQIARYGLGSLPAHDTFLVRSTDVLTANVPAA